MPMCIYSLRSLAGLVEFVSTSLATVPTEQEKRKIALLAPMWYNMHFDSFLRQRYTLCDFSACSAERGALSISNGG